VTVEKSSVAEDSTIDVGCRSRDRLERWPHRSASTLCPIELNPESWRITS
jgi:hypothetical protein